MTGAAIRRHDAGTRRLLRGGVGAGPLFIGAFLLEGITRADYRPSRHPVSSLALGPHGWMQTANFTIAGALYLSFAAGLQRAPRAIVPSKAGPILVGAAAVGMIGSGAFTTDPISGYPPGTPDARGAYTPSGAMHDLVAMPTFLGLPAAAFAFARGFLHGGERRWAAYSAGSGLTMLTAFAMASAAFSQMPRLVNIGGLLQRASVITGFGWLTALAARTLAASRDD